MKKLSRKEKLYIFLYNIENNNLKLNIIFNFFLKGISIGINFLLIPLMLRYLDNEEYGVWILILSITGWIYTFDIGIGNGLKNKISQYLVLKKYNEIKRFIITSYIVVSIISFIIFIILFISLKYFNLHDYLNINFLDEKKIFYLLIINIGFVCFNFILSLCNNIFIGSQKVCFSYLNNALSQFFILLSIIGLSFKKEKSIFYLSIFYGLSISFSHIILTVVYFWKNKLIIPKISDISLNKISNIVNIGGKIFFIQISGLIIFTTDNFIISRFLGPEKIVEYSIVNKFFSIPIIIISLILTPIWPKSTEKYYLKDYKWFANILKKFNKFFIGIFICIFIMVIIGGKVINIWTRSKITPSFYLILLNAISTLLICYSNIFGTFLCGINETSLFMWVALSQSFFNLILSYYFIKYTNLKVNGVVLATCLCMLESAVILPKILNKKLKNL